MALIPLLASGFVYEVVNDTLGLMGKAGLLMSNQTLSIMTILLFAAVIDYSLFVFSRYREELKHYESKYDAMKMAMRETGMPVLFAGGTVLAAMLVLFFAHFGDLSKLCTNLWNDHGHHHACIDYAYPCSLYFVREKIILAKNSSCWG